MNLRKTQTVTRWALTVLAVTAAASCVNDAPTSTVQIYSWWTTASEYEALNAVLMDFKQKNPGVAVDNAVAQDSLTALDTLQSRMREHDPPDTFQVNGGTELRQYVAGAASQLEALDFLAAEQGWSPLLPGGQGTPPPLMPAEVLQTVTFGGHVYAVPVDIARVNALFYNKATFGSLGLTAPVTLDDFVYDAQILSQNNIKPLAVGDAAPWTLEVIFKSCLVAAANATGKTNYYKEFAAGLNPNFGPGGVGDATFDEAVSCFGTLLSYANKTEMRTLTWDQAVAEVSSGNPAMTIMGDWAHGEFLRDLGTADVTFGEVAAPGSADTFIFTTDTFVLPIGAQHRAGAIALLTEWGSATGQRFFYPYKGSLPSRTDTNPSAYDALSIWTQNELQTKALVPDWAMALPQAFTTAFDAALDRFADDENAENVVLAAKNNYYLIVQGHWP
jgi:glucose/mannose transport system substrate-binding protein